jgi:hypothetical protein
MARYQVESVGPRVGADPPLGGGGHCPGPSRHERDRLTGTALAGPAGNHRWHPSGHG